MPNEIEPYVMAKSSSLQALRPQTPVELLDSAVALYRNQVGPLLRQLLLLLGSVALLKLLASPSQPGQWATLSPLQSRALLDAFALLAAGVPVGDVFADYGGLVVYHILIWVLLINVLLPVLNRDPALAETPPFAGVSALGAILMIPIGMLTITWADLLRDLGLVVGAALANRLDIAALVAPILITHAPNLLISLVALAIVAPTLLAAPAAYIERLSSQASIRRSVGLTRGSVGRLFWLVLLASIIGAACVAAPATAFALASDPLGATVSLALPSVVASLLNQAAEAAVVPFQLAVLLLCYRDRRVRAEGYDLSLRIQPNGPEN